MWIGVREGRKMEIFNREMVWICQVEAWLSWSIE